MAKKLKWNLILMSVLYLGLGIFLLMRPSTALNVVCYALGGVVLVCAAVQLVRYFAVERGIFQSQLTLISGIICLGLGAFLILRSDIVVRILPIVFGLFVIFDSLGRIQNALDLRRCEYPSWKGFLLLPVLSVVLGVVMILNPFGTMETLVMAIGIILIIEGAINLLSALYTVLAIRRFAKLHPETQSMLESLTGQDLNGDGEYSSDEIVYPESAFVAMNYKGEIQAMVGATGEKTESLCFNYATMEQRQPGSTIKPLTTYGLALESDLIHWGSIYKDEPIEVEGKAWPTNYSEDSSAMSISHKELKVYEALEKSYNTVPAQLCQALTPQSVFDFATSKMKLDLCKDSGNGHTDVAYSPLTVGALTYGVTLENLVNGYVPYGNGGTQYKAHLVSKVVQGAGDLVYENDGAPEEAVSSETAYVMNQLLQDIVNNGTGQKAKLKNKHVGGKTGTTQDWNDLTFVGLTEDFVSGVWLGYKERSELEDHHIKSAQIWYNIIGEYADQMDTGAEYPSNDKIVEGKVCARSGKIAGPNCEATTTGYWKSSNAPVCDECSKYSKPKSTKTTTENGDESTTTAASGDHAQQNGTAASANQPGLSSRLPTAIIWLSFHRAVWVKQG